MPQDRGHRRKHSRSLSPIPNKHKRSWQNDISGSGDGGRPFGRHRSPSPMRRDTKLFKSPSKLGGHKTFHASSPGGHKSRSPRNQKRSRPRSPYSGRGLSPSFSRQPHLHPNRDYSRPVSRPSHLEERERSRIRHVPPLKAGVESFKLESKFNKSTPNTHTELTTKKKLKQSPPPKRPRSRSPANSTLKRSEPSSQPHQRETLMSERKVSSVSKKKQSRVTLHKRFTQEEQEPFELEENVTIAILRNPNAEPSEDVTVKKVFDASLFKMVHKKAEGKKPIFDREEIKLWRHDENLSDEPDFERRLVRVKSTSSAPKLASESLSRMSPNVIRKAFGLQIGVRSKSKSPHRDGQVSRSRSPRREPQIRLDPRPDPRYESKFREQLEREEEIVNRGKRQHDKVVGSMDKKGIKNQTRDGKHGKRNDRGKEEPYDLRQALERRRSDRVEGSGFRIEVQRGEGDAELFYREDTRGQGSSVENHPNVSDLAGGRSVVMDQNKDQRRFSSIDRDQQRFGSADRDSRGSWENDRRTVRGRGRGNGRIRGRRRPWSPDIGLDGGKRQDDSRDVRDKILERRHRYSMSPNNNRGWRGYRGRGRGRGRDFILYDQDISSPTEIDDSFKYTQVRRNNAHDDRDVSPKVFRSRGGRGRFPMRSFGSSNFRANSRGFRGGGVSSGRGFRGGYRGGYNSMADRRSLERRNTSLDREWKHDMYDSLIAEDDQSHRTAVIS
ncbi:unnamed protein product [Lymnaea stagnalis]|uniref:Btz domain-containing protein n=1 Tax=Lymnaea stagnalis TaxID=6523 RepID=A0AAV2IEZ8_LYMST